MSDFLKSISSYNLFNNLLPGVVSSVLISKLFLIPFIQADIVVGIFFYYFVGLIVSRFGSIVVEPILKKIGFLSFAPYPDYIVASKEDIKIEVLSETNNMYRTMLSMMLLIALIGIYSFLKSQFEFLEKYSTHTMIGSLILLFFWSYQKQTQFIKSRVSKVIDKGG